jgi:hypothetical protein
MSAIAALFPIFSLRGASRSFNCVQASKIAAPYLHSLLVIASKMTTVVNKATELNAADAEHRTSAATLQVSASADFQAQIAQTYT